VYRYRNHVVSVGSVYRYRSHVVSVGSVYRYRNHVVSVGSVYRYRNHVVSVGSVYRYRNHVVRNIRFWELLFLYVNVVVLVIVFEEMIIHIWPIHVTLFDYVYDDFSRKFLFYGGTCFSNFLNIYVN